MKNYRGYEILHNPKPIPDFRHDWEFRNPQIEEDCGTAASEVGCKEQIDDILNPPDQWEVECRRLGV